MNSNTTPTIAAAPTTHTTTLLVRKDALASARLHSSPFAELQSGQARLRVESFALTSNNITYAAFGDAMHYWQFFPTTEDGWGVIPVWGFAVVTQSLHPELPVGERVYGYWPFASHAVLTPGKVNSNGFVDAAPHRAALHPVYNGYTRSGGDPFYTAPTEALQSLLRPLFTTSWLIDDFLADNAFFGATTLLLSSASSKTAYGTAFGLIQRPGVQVVGLTSASNRAFCESLGCYSRVLSYQELDHITADTACVYVDFAGNADLRHAIHSRFAQLSYSCAIGGTHVEHLGGGKDLPGPKATLFFAPAQIKKRLAEWGPSSFQERQIAAWQAFMVKVTTSSPPWLEVRSHVGGEAVLAAYAQVLAGQGDPREGHVLSLN